MPTFAGPEGWAWLVLGLGLIGLEVAAPGVFMLWLGIAAVLTGLVALAVTLPWQGALVLFASLAIVSVLVGRALARRRGAGDAEQPWLNRRGDALVGRAFVLDRPIVAGEGRVRVDDSVWRAVGPDAPAGTAVRVLRIDGATLVVGPAV